MRSHVTLTMGPGVVVKYGGPFELLIQGRIVANGTESLSIVFAGLTRASHRGAECSSLKERTRRSSN